MLATRVDYKTSRCKASGLYQSSRAVCSRSLYLGSAHARMLVLLSHGATSYTNHRPIKEFGVISMKHEGIQS